MGRIEAGVTSFPVLTTRRYNRMKAIGGPAARLLEQNRRVTGSWPLAITAYNHGASGMRRAVRKLGSQDIAVISQKYKSRSFGFASRNFYAEFLAALRISRNPEKFFGPIRAEETPQFERVELPFYTTADALAQKLDLQIETLKHRKKLKHL